MGSPADNTPTCPGCGMQPQVRGCFVRILDGSKEHWTCRAYESGGEVIDVRAVLRAGGFIRLSDFDGVTEERFEELRAAGVLPLGIRWEDVLKAREST